MAVVGLACKSWVYNYTIGLFTELLIRSGFKYAQLELSTWAYILLNQLLTSKLSPEVILSILLSSFKFELTDKSIFWNHAGVMYPTVETESKRPEMPLTVSQL